MAKQLVILDAKNGLPKGTTERECNGTARIEIFEFAKSHITAETTRYNHRYILALDVGTTSVKAIIYDENLLTISKASSPILEYTPQPGWSEISPDHLWEAVVGSCKNAISAGGIISNDITAMGISAQRNTFITCDTETGRPFHNFITWKDKRSQTLADSWNSSNSIRAMRAMAKGLLFVTRGAPKWRSLVNLQLAPVQTLMRLLWALNNVEDLRTAVSNGKARFGNLETWLIWKLTGGKTWVAEASGLMTSAMFDAYITESWNKPFLNLLGVPRSILPKITDSICSDYGQVDEIVFGASFPITAVLADQSASLVGECCFTETAANLTVGTGGFLNVVTGMKPIAVTKQVFPTMVFKNGKDIIYAAEVYLPAASYLGNIVDTLLTDGYLDDINKLDEVANSVDDTAGVVFVPNQGDGKEGHQIQGKTESTKPAHVVRAALQSVADVIKDLALQLESEAPDINVLGNTDMEGMPLPPVRIDGGVSQSDFVCQAIANALKRNVERLKDVEASARGVAMLAGYGAMMFPSMAYLEQLALGKGDTHRKFTVFTPQNS